MASDHDESVAVHEDATKHPASKPGNGNADRRSMAQPDFGIMPHFVDLRYFDAGKWKQWELATGLEDIPSDQIAVSADADHTVGVVVFEAVHEHRRSRPFIAPTEDMAVSAQRSAH
jgi:hypothetical protein